MPVHRVSRPSVYMNGHPMSHVQPVAPVGTSFHIEWDVENIGDQGSTIFLQTRRVRRPDGAQVDEVISRGRAISVPPGAVETMVVDMGTGQALQAGAHLLVIEIVDANLRVIDVHTLPLTLEATAPPQPSGPMFRAVGDPRIT